MLQGASGHMASGTKKQARPLRGSSTPYQRPRWTMIPTIEGTEPWKGPAISPNSRVLRFRPRDRSLLPLSDLAAFARRMAKVEHQQRHRDDIVARKFGGPYEICSLQTDTRGLAGGESRPRPLRGSQAGPFHRDRGISTHAGRYRMVAHRGIEPPVSNSREFC